MALGYQNPFYLKQAQKKQQSLYDGKVLLEKHDPPVVHDSKETLQLAQESHQKMKQLNKEIKPANYTKINHLSRVFVSLMAKSREELYFSDIYKTANVSKPISIPNEEFWDDTTPNVARKFINEVKSTIVTLQRVVKHRMTVEAHNWSSSAHQEHNKIVKDENFPIVNQVDAGNVISKVVCAMCKQCLISVNHDVCLRNYVNGKTSHGKKQKANVSIKEKQKKHQPKGKKTKKVGFTERLATPKPTKPRFFLRWSPTGRLFDLKGKIIKSSESESQSDCSNGSMHLLLTLWNIKSNGFQILLLCLAGYLNLFMVCRLGLFQAHDRKSNASHQFCLEVYGNCSLQK
nr:hypothetical protein [Tanacetum cinerariifolium]